MSFGKKIRELVYNKTKGYCAYCGCELPKKWHIDHLQPARRDLTTGEYDKSLDDVDNLLPACPSCNIIKSSQPLESFRHEIENMYNSVNNGTFKVAERYGIVTREKKEIKFYFEKEEERRNGIALRERESDLQ